MYYHLNFISVVSYNSDYLSPNRNLSLINYISDDDWYHAQYTPQEVWLPKSLEL